MYETQLYIILMLFCCTHWVYRFHSVVYCPPWMEQYGWTPRKVLLGPFYPLPDNPALNTAHKKNLKTLWAVWRWYQDSVWDASKPISLFKPAWCSLLMRLDDNECIFFSWLCSLYWRTKAESVTQSVLSSPCVGTACVFTQSSQSLELFCYFLFLILSSKEYTFTTRFTSLIFTW